ncbi:bifunctional diaminohydroxyphosphoribosylaminopyrimidine deaminase/5-amino-6-(5-phosphoribosylamino)uracil reductase RibD [Dethiobacter alkaliphilus]|uniref:bifunctional diaminohydroxyphosphoribosylaminopyrimidine deaminase/5-amino-6-(5-phosphoribosylamino)uracil reductase RibD n=1 Tax=Dethiobacter alkaliphilus TaxID=427926 RepID=UPI0022268162|nr:bifunctional diaminohydroxyphosphoribosylaminopyrimidine deaminase/5-amino-6-(5-phosphoribosylamino)uracil reductase RibD [Dethiobacter alkaliphilus]MCW3490890.1 bifunctional diaminohydroxyphosphoribosylaminopyrimidine deaminase/5-amino-6-(5-phosphoribosylamino)uracil reductase RibD [Dethiobacter alkaliphilus]
MDADERYMWLALDLAAQGQGTTSPNPMVGAVLVKDGETVGTGYHQKAGEPHAEIIALEEAGEAARGATLYVTLEPCSHTGKTPPCVDRIIAAGVRKVVVAMQDPNELVNGLGLKKLQEAGIKVKSGVLEEKALRLNEVFVKYITSRRPFVTMKAAMTMDGKIATRTKASRWISGERSREFGHRLRHHTDAIMVGIGTLLADNPSLTTRLPEGGKNPLRIVVDSKANTPLDSKVVAENPEKTLIFVTDLAGQERISALQAKGVGVEVLPADPEGRVPLDLLMDNLGKHEISSVLVEGGSVLNYSLLASGLVDKVYFFMAPLIFGGDTAPTPVGGTGVATVQEAWHVKDIEISHYDTDLLITGYIEYNK